MTKIDNLNAEIKIHSKTTCGEDLFSGKTNLIIKNVVLFQFEIYFDVQPGCLICKK